MFVLYIDTAWAWFNLYQTPSLDTFSLTKIKNTRERMTLNSNVIISKKAKQHIITICNFISEATEYLKRSTAFSQTLKCAQTFLMYLASWWRDKQEWKYNSLGEYKDVKRSQNVIFFCMSEAQQPVPPQVALPLVYQFSIHVFIICKCASNKVG